jgi:hypothetical protein
MNYGDYDAGATDNPKTHKCDTSDIYGYDVTMGRKPTMEDALTVRLRPGMLPRLRTIEKRVGVPVAEQIRRGVEMWLEEQDPVRTKGKGTTR